MKSKAKNGTARKLEGLGISLVKEIDRSKNPGIDIPLRNLSNVRFNEKKEIIELGEQKQSRIFFNVAMAKKFMQTLLVAAECKKHIQEGKTTSLRDLYYMILHTIPGTAEETVDDQDESDECVEDLEVSLDELRESLGLFATNKGSLVGELTLLDNGDPIDGRRMGSGGWSIPSIVEPSVIQFKKCTAKFILLVEKDAVWRRLNEDKFWQKHKCILLHGQGMAPRGVRRLLYRMVHELNIPLYVVADNDPWGYYIYSVVKQGSINLAYESMRMAVPEARFIGLTCDDVTNFKLTKTIKLDDQDISRAKQILGYPWFKAKHWQAEIRKMLQANRKLELEALSARGISFISEQYLPKKLKDRDWLD
jgi:DNA topoisomerase-6 subunit A